MTGLEEFLHMGGYALYVWGSYAVTLIVLVANALLPRRRERQLLRALAARGTDTGQSR